MAINKKLIHFNTKVNFNTQLQSGNILDTSIVFIKETKEIWTHGQLYPCPLSLEEITTLLSKKVDKVTGKSLVSDSEIEKLLGLPNNTELNNLITTAKAAGDNAQSDLNAHKQDTSNPHKVTKAQVGLGNVTNDAQVKRSEMGVANGVATLDADGKVPASQLPSYVDDIIDVYATYSKSDTGVLSNVTLYLDAAHTQLVTGEAGKIYQNIADGEPQYQFRWTGTIFSQTGASSLILGEVTGTAYDGAKGKANADNIAKIKGTSLSHIKDAAPVTTAADKVSINYECFEGDQYGAAGTAHTADIPAATTAKAGVMSAADKVKLNNTASIKEFDNFRDDFNYLRDDFKYHETDQDEVRHIPRGGHERQILVCGEEGRAKWDDLSNMFTGLEELLAYGVEWKDNVADPHLTRIGNMSLHKTLPIQSQLKGCIAQKDKVMYWLAEDDWRFRKDPIYMKVAQSTVDLLNGVEELKFGDSSLDSVASLAAGQFIKAGTHIGKIARIEANKVIVEWEEELADIEAELTTITKREIGSRLDGYDGTVRVYCPNFYIKSQIIGNTRRVWLSTVKIDNTWTYQHEILIDAYRSTVLNTVPKNMVYLSTLYVNSAISVVNTATYCRGGGNRPAYDKYLTGAGNTAIDIFRTDLGKPRTNLDRDTTRYYSRQADSEMLSYNQYKNIFYWLYVVEYANFNCQEEYNATLTEDGYHQGGMGSGVTTMPGSHWEQYNGFYPLTPCGYCNELGNGTGIKNMTIETPYATHTFQVPRWRGFDNPFGDIWTNLEGILIRKTTKDLSNVYTTDNVFDYTDTLREHTLAGKECSENGPIKLFDLGETAEIIPRDIDPSASFTEYKCDMHYGDNGISGLRTLLVGGSGFDGSGAGLGWFNSAYDVYGTEPGVGFRSVSLFVSFSWVE